MGNLSKTTPGQGVSRAQKHSQRALALATLLFVLSSGFTVYVLSTMVTTTLTELVYFVDTTCVVHKITLHEEPVPCIVPSCGNILTQSGCRQTGYCLRVALNFSIKDEHAELLKMPVEHTSWAPMAELKLHNQYKRAHGNDADGTGGIPCTGFEAGVEGDRKCRPTKTYDTAMYAPSVAVTLAAPPADVAEADGRKLELIDPTDSGRCFAISCREDGALARREALELMSYWPEGSTLPSCHYLRSFSPVDKYLNDGSPPVIVSKRFDPIMVGYWAASAIFVWTISCQICLERLQSHHDVGNKGTSDDFLHGVAGSRDKKKLANLRGNGRRA
jgi:hypothetical protein